MTPTPPLALKPKAIMKFWARVKKSSGCWEWTGYYTPSGYGRMRIENKHRLMHRLSWEMKNGPIPDGMQVCHHCDNPPCVKPSHLFLGTQMDNVKDMIAKGRWRAGDRRGERNACSKLNKDKVVKIKCLLRRKVNQGTIGKMFGVGSRAISAIKRGKTWNHV